MNTKIDRVALSLGSKEAVNERIAQIKAGGYPTLSGPRITGDEYYESCISGFERNIIEITV